MTDFLHEKDADYEHQQLLRLLGALAAHYSGEGGEEDALIRELGFQILNYLDTRPVSRKNSRN